MRLVLISYNEMIMIYSQYKHVRGRLLPLLRRRQMFACSGKLYASHKVCCGRNRRDIPLYHEQTSIHLYCSHLNMVGSRSGYYCRAHRVKGRY